jgi:hypothetical protein
MLLLCHDVAQASLHSNMVLTRQAHVAFTVASALYCAKLPLYVMVRVIDQPIQQQCTTAALSATAAVAASNLYLIITA